MDIRSFSQFFLLFSHIHGEIAIRKNKSMGICVAMRKRDVGLVGMGEEESISFSGKSG